jgi:hypothetical protein
VVVVRDRPDAKLIQEIGGFDVVFDGMVHGNLAHDCEHV